MYVYKWFSQEGKLCFLVSCQIISFYAYFLYFFCSWWCSCKLDAVCIWPLAKHNKISIKRNREAQTHILTRSMFLFWSLIICLFAVFDLSRFDMLIDNGIVIVPSNGVLVSFVWYLGCWVFYSSKNVLDAFVSLIDPYSHKWVG